MNLKNLCKIQEIKELLSHIIKENVIEIVWPKILVNKHKEHLKKLYF
jgi:hypothetical protein